MELGSSRSPKKFLLKRALSSYDRVKGANLFQSVENHEFRIIFVKNLYFFSSIIIIGQHG